jgi:hypothetical protein
MKTASQGNLFDQEQPDQAILLRYQQALEQHLTKLQAASKIEDQLTRQASAMSWTSQAITYASLTLDVLGQDRMAEILQDIDHCFTDCFTKTAQEAENEGKA